MAIFLIRHGETDSNARRVIQTPDAPLSVRGQRQAALLAERLADADVRAVLSSDLARATMTAEALCATTGAPLAQDAVLQERNFGDLRGRAYEEVGVDIFAPGYVPPGGESWDEFHTRVAAAWERIQAALGECGGHLAVVTHGLVCRSLVATHVTLPTGWGVPEGWENTALTIIEAAPPWRVSVLNCIAHLEQDTGALDPLVKGHDIS